VVKEKVKREVGTRGRSGIPLKSEVKDGEVERTRVVERERMQQKSHEGRNDLMKKRKERLNEKRKER
jgi:hypothetical protein